MSGEGTMSSPADTTPHRGERRRNVRAGPHGLGGIPFPDRDGLAGIWSVLIGWFLREAAAGAHQQARLDETLGGMTAADMMLSDVATLPAHISVAEAAQERFPPHRPWRLSRRAGRGGGRLAQPARRAPPRCREAPGDVGPGGDEAALRGGCRPAPDPVAGRAGRSCSRMDASWASSR